MALIAHPKYHSAAVTMLLESNGGAFEVAQLGPDFLILATAQTLLAGPATLTLRIDEAEERQAISLSEGSTAASPRVRFTATR